MAQRAIPLVADSDPVEVIYEDDAIIAVNKPAGVISAPKHRFTVTPIPNVAALQHTLSCITSFAQLMRLPALEAVSWRSGYLALICSICYCRVAAWSTGLLDTWVREVNWLHSASPIKMHDSSLQHACWLCNYPVVYQKQHSSIQCNIGLPSSMWLSACARPPCAATGYPPYPVHRLDMMTSGVLVMAKQQSAAGPLSAQFRCFHLSLAHLVLAYLCVA